MTAVVFPVQGHNAVLVDVYFFEKHRAVGLIRKCVRNDPAAIL